MDANAVTSVGFAPVKNGVLVRFPTQDLHRVNEHLCQVGAFIIAVRWRGHVNDTPYLIVESIVLTALKPNTDV